MIINLDKFYKLNTVNSKINIAHSKMVINNLQIWESDNSYIYVGRDILIKDKNTNNIKKVKLYYLNNFNFIKKIEKNNSEYLNDWWIYEYYNIYDNVSQIIDIPNNDEIKYETGGISINEFNYGIEIMYNNKPEKALMFIKEINWNRIEFDLKKKNIHDWIYLYYFLKKNKKIFLFLDKNKIRNFRFLF